MQLSVHACVCVCRMTRSAWPDCLAVAAVVAIWPVWPASCSAAAVVVAAAAISLVSPVNFSAEEAVVEVEVSQFSFIDRTDWERLVNPSF